MADHQEKELIANLRGLEVSGFRERTIQRPLHSLVTISVDGDQQLETSVSVDTLAPKWTFSPPLQLMVRPSSTIKFTVYREHLILSKVGNNHHCCGEVEMELQAALVDPHRKHKLKRNWSSREDGLEISVDLQLQPMFRHDTLLRHADERLRGHRANRDMEKSTSVASYIGLAIDNLETVVTIMDGVVEIHPLCKVAWTVLSSVYKAFKDEHALDDLTKVLAVELRDTLAYAKECRDLQAIPEATDVIHEIAKLVVESAAVFDAHVKRSVIVRTASGAASKTNLHRISDCDTRLKALRKKLAEVLMIRIWQGQNMLIQQNGLRHNPSEYSLIGGPSSMSTPIYYAPPAGLFKDGYSPIYLSTPPDDACSSPPSTPPSPPPPLLLLPSDDNIRRYTSSPEPMHSRLPSTSSSADFSPPPIPSRDLRDVSPTWSPWPMSSRTPSYSSFTTDTGRTLSSKSSCSSLAEPSYEHFASNPQVVQPSSPTGAEDRRDLDYGSSSCCRPVDGVSPKLTSSAQPRIAMPMPMSWSQSHW